MIEDFISKIDPEQITTPIVNYLPNIVASLLLIAVFWVVLTIVRKMADGSMKRADVPVGVRQLVDRFIKYAVVILGLLTIANQLGINVMSLVAGLGVAGLAVSLAAQDTMKNIIAGITIAVDRPFKQGDWVCIGDKNLQVTDIRLRTTVFTSFENETLVMPNQEVSSERIINYTLTQRIRVRVPLGIAYEEDIDEAREVVFDTMEGDDRILEDPEPKVLVLELGASSVNMELRFWIEDPWEMYSARCEYIEKCKKALDAADIEIPYPHTQLLLERSEALSEWMKTAR